jgi:hypothetical protein
MNLILLTLVLGASDPPPLQPVGPNVIDRGTARTGPPLTASLTLTHRGEPGTVTVTAVEASCGCTAPTLTSRRLRPGDTTDFAISVNTLTQPAGVHTWKATLRYRFAPDAAEVAPQDFDATLALTADLVREVSVTPPVLAISTATEARQTLTVTDIRAKPLTVRAATTASPHVALTVRPAATADGVTTTVVELHVKPDYPAGSSQETITLTTDDPGCPELRVPVRIVKRNPDALVPSPELAAVRFSPGQDAASTLVQVRSPARGTLRIEAAGCDHPAVGVKFAASSGLVGTLRVVVDRAKADGRPGEALVRVRFAEPPGATLVLPVQWSFPE